MQDTLVEIYIPDRTDGGEPQSLTETKHTCQLRLIVRESTLGWFKSMLSDNPEERECGEVWSIP